MSRRGRGQDSNGGPRKRDLPVRGTASGQAPPGVIEQGRGGGLRLVPDPGSKDHRSRWLRIVPRPDNELEVGETRREPEPPTAA